VTNVPPATQFGKKAKNFLFASDQVALKSSKACFVTQNPWLARQPPTPLSYWYLWSTKSRKSRARSSVPWGKSSEEQHVYRVIYIHATLSFPAPHNSCSHPLIHSLSQPISVSVFLLKTVFCRLFPFNTCDIATTTIITGGEVAPPFPQGSGSLFFLAIFGPVCSVGFGRPLQLPILNVIAISNR